MTSASVISKDLIIPMPFEDYLKTLTRFMTPKRYYNPFGFSLSIQREGNVAHIEATHMVGSLLYAGGTLSLKGSISATADNQTFINYKIDAQDIYNALARQGAMSNITFLFALLTISCLLVAYLSIQPIIIIALTILLYLIYAISINILLRPKTPNPYIQHAEQLMTNFENRFLKLIVPPEK
jgi:hypothetical protein